MTGSRSQIIAVNEFAWQEFQPGIALKVLWQDPSTKRRAQMTRFAPGAQLPMHRHVGDELIFVIEGAISDESGTVTAGNVGYRPNGCVHTVTSKNGATALAVLTGDIESATDRAGAPGGMVCYTADGCVHPATSKSGARARPVLGGDIDPPTDRAGAPRSAIV